MPTAPSVSDWRVRYRRRNDSRGLQLNESLFAPSYNAEAFARRARVENPLSELDCACCTKNARMVGEPPLMSSSPWSEKDERCAPRVCLETLGEGTHILVIFDTLRPRRSDGSPGVIAVGQCRRSAEHDRPAAIQVVDLPEGRDALAALDAVFGRRQLERSIPGVQ